MNEYDRVALYKPAQPPFFEYPNAESALRQPYVPCWINSQGVAVPLATRGSHLRKSALATIRRHINDGSAPELNHHTRYYIWDTSRTPWNPDDLNCWTPTAERPCNQWTPSR